MNSVLFLSSTWNWELYFENGSWYTDIKIEKKKTLFFMLNDFIMQILLYCIIVIHVSLLFILTVSKLNNVIIVQIIS
jgi:hypothetical protein